MQKIKRGHLGQKVAPTRGRTVKIADPEERIYRLRNKITLSEKVSHRAGEHERAAALLATLI